MNKFSCENYFELTNFQHQKLFETCQYVWESLSNIKPYLEKQTLGVIETKVPKEATLIHPETISIGEGTVIEPGACIIGPCIIGKNCQVRQGAYIRGFVICGDNSVIGHATEVKHSILLNHACAAHFNYLGDSILGNHTNLGAGTICANLRFDKKPVVVFFEDRHVNTGLKKFGAILGDFSQSGCNSVLNPGTLLERGASVYPCTHVKGVVSGSKKESRSFFRKSID